MAYTAQLNLVIFSLFNNDSDNQKYTSLLVRHKVSQKAKFQKCLYYRKINFNFIHLELNTKVIYELRKVAKSEK